MALVGYARISTADQDYEKQVEVLKKAGCKKIFSENKTDTTIKERSELQQCLKSLREGDTLVVTRIDRLARSLMDLQNLVLNLKEEGIELKALEQPVDTGTATGKAFLDMLGVFAEFENNVRRERQLDGIAKAKKEGKYKGRKPTARRKADQVLNLIQQGKTRQSVADELGIGVASVYRILANAKNMEKNHAK